MATGVIPPMGKITERIGAGLGLINGTGVVRVVCDFESRVSTASRRSAGTALGFTDSHGDPKFRMNPTDDSISGGKGGRGEDKVIVFQTAASTVSSPERRSSFTS